MSEEFIRVHKPVAVQLANATKDAVKKVVRRKSTVRRSTVRKPVEVEEQQPATDTNEILYQVFNSFEEKLNKTKQDIHQDLFDSIYDNTFQYFSFYYNKRVLCSSSVLDGLNGTDKIRFNPICNVIPTIALYTGINSQDYSYLCDNLSESLKNTWTRNLFYVNEKNSNNIKSLANSIFAQWENVVEDKQSLIKRNLFTFKYLFDTIKMQNDEDSDCISSKSVIFIFKQFELIPKETIECFVSLVSCHVENLPIYFIIELASQSNVIYEQLSSNIISKLCIKKLYLMSPEQYIDKFLNKLFIEQSTLFRLSGDILQYLIELYYDYNFSISNFVQALKYCFFDHLQENELNAFFISRELENFEMHEQIRKNVVENNKVNKDKLTSIRSDFNENTASICVQNMQNEWQQYNNQFVIVCKFLFELVKHFPAEQDQNSLFSRDNKNFIDFYAKICQFSSMKNKTKHFCETEQFMELKKLLQLCSTNTTNEIASTFLKLIEVKVFNDQANYQSDFLNDMHEFCEILGKIRTNYTVTNADNSLNEDEIEKTMMKPPEITDEMVAKKRLGAASLNRRSSIRTLKPIQEHSPPKRRNTMCITQATQKQLIKNQSTKTIEQAKMEMFDWLCHQFATYFDNDYTSYLPFANFFCYSKLNHMVKRLFDVQRINVHECLLNSHEYLKNNNYLPEDSDSFSPGKRRRSLRRSPTSGRVIEETKADALTALSAVYKLYLECGHMINLFDWLQAVVEKELSADLKDLSEPKRKLYQALFFRSNTELQFMGFIKPTSRKVDHVVKLTNGSSLLALES